MIPYGKQSIDQDDIAAVVEVLKSDWLTTGPKVEEFEQAICGYVGAEYAVAVSSGTAALHAAMFALDIGPGDEVIVPPMTFAATANCIVYQGGTPVFADVDAETLLIDPVCVEQKVTKRTKAVIAVDYAGQPCDYDALRAITDRHGLALIADGCHALGATYKGKPVGAVADMTAFSFHPVKHITTGEGGMITTDSPDYADRMRRFRNHGISSDHRQREAQGSWFYQMVDLGFNYRMTDIQCALGISQLKKLPLWIDRRREIAAQYDAAFSTTDDINSLGLRSDVCSAATQPSTVTPHPSAHAYHLYVTRVSVNRSALFRWLREAGIGANVHYVPVHLHPFYREQFGTRPQLCPVAESAYEQLISLPMFPGMSKGDVDQVIDVARETVNA
jgi:UDP-4-amino-4,6-dideoxy-N-acetyl-beta-L-altrosamine transaminase